MERFINIQEALILQIGLLWPGLIVWIFLMFFGVYMGVKSFFFNKSQDATKGSNPNSVGGCRKLPSLNSCDWSYPLQYRAISKLRLATVSPGMSACSLPISGGAMVANWSLHGCGGRSPKVFAGLSVLYGAIDRKSSPIEPALRTLITVLVSRINWCVLR